MEQSEARDTQQRETDHRCQHLQRIFVKGVSLVEDPVYHESAERHNAAVNQKDTPVRQRVLGEIPVQYLVKWISHKPYLALKRCKGTNK
jgi:hypothetical protein